MFEKGFYSNACAQIYRRCQREEYFFVAGPVTDNYFIIYLRGGAKFIINWGRGGGGCIAHWIAYWLPTQGSNPSIPNFFSQEILKLQELIDGTA